ncbi:hypothetical protein [Dendrosporobacter sp. 1207_IL3150]|uniref:hypothetical protein n=1 Tax=Dendrosporobacter sp. 1207_IL3150 TaxID=3084054 RepID=UPI002FD8D785
MKMNYEPELTSYSLPREEVEKLLSQYGSKLEPIDSHKLAQHKAKQLKTKFYNQKFSKQGSVTM